MGSRPVQHPRELKTYVKKAICDGKRFTTFSRLLVPAEADKTVKELVCTLSRRDGYVQDFLFLCWTFDFLLCKIHISEKKTIDVVDYIKKM